MQIMLNIPDDLFPAKNLPRKALEGLVLMAFNTGGISSGMVAKILGLSRYEADGFLKKYGAYNKFTIADLNKEVKAFYKAKK